MRRPVTTALLVVALSNAGVLAFEGMEYRPYTCWSLMPTHFGIGAKVDLVATLDAGRVVAVTVNGYEPDSEVGYEIAAEAVEAVEACGPYGELSGEFELVMDVDNPPKPEPSVKTSIPLPGTQ